MATESAKAAQAELRSLGLKVTEPRLRILELFSRAPEKTSVRHLTAEDIYRQLMEVNLDVGLATVYRVLTQFEGVGLIVRRNLGNGLATYELNNGAHHDHMICVRCGRIEEFSDDAIERRQKEIAKQYNFTLQRHSLSLYGLCADCCDKEKKKH